MLIVCIENTVSLSSLLLLATSIGIKAIDVARSDKHKREIVYSMHKTNTHVNREN
jgi:hypothetical protein